MSDFRVGDSVQTRATVRPAQFADREGTVMVLSEGEVGVRFGSAKNHDQITTWFRPSELQRLGGARSLQETPGGPQTGEGQ